MPDSDPTNAVSSPSLLDLLLGSASQNRPNIPVSPAQPSQDQTDAALSQMGNSAVQSAVAANGPQAPSRSGDALTGPQGKPSIPDSFAQGKHPIALAILQALASGNKVAGEPVQNLSQPSTHPVVSRILAALGGLANAAGQIGQPTSVPLARQQLAQQMLELQSRLPLTAATTAETQARTAQTEAQTQMMQSRVPVQVPGIGLVYLPPAVAAQYMKGALGASITGQSRENVANINAASRMDVETMKAKLLSGEVSRIVPVQDEKGNTVMRAYNRFMQPIGDVQGGLPPSAYLPKTSSTVDFKQLDDGSIVAIPKTTVTAPVVGGRSAAGPSVAGGTGIHLANGIVTLNGQPLIGKGATTSTTRTMVETAPKVLDLTDRMESQIDALEKSGQLGPGASRWNDFWSGKVGTDNPQFHAFQTNATLLSTLLMRMHMGARGSQQIMEHFTQMLGAGHQSAANMRAALDEIKAYANDVKGAAPLPPNFGNSNRGGSPAAPPAGAKVRVFNPTTGTLQ